MTTASNNTLCCHWCGVSLAGASQVTYLNGNLPVCGLCLLKAQQPVRFNEIQGNPFVSYGGPKWEGKK